MWGGAAPEQLVVLEGEAAYALLMALQGREKRPRVQRPDLIREWGVF